MIYIYMFTMGYIASLGQADLRTMTMYASYAWGRSASDHLLALACHYFVCFSAASQLFTMYQLLYVSLRTCAVIKISFQSSDDEEKQLQVCSNLSALHVMQKVSCLCPLCTYEYDHVSTHQSVCVCQCHC